MRKKNILARFLDSEALEEVMEDIPVGKKNEFLGFLKKQYLKELQNSSPTIAVIGRTGVGKSSTLNALFNLKLPVHHTRPATKKPERIRIESHTKRGKGTIYFYDMPGIGEDRKADQKYLRKYVEVLGQCHVAVWVMSEDDRDMSYDLDFFETFKDSTNSNLASRLVIGINKYDRIYPGENDWDGNFNLPSREQEHYMQERIEYVKEKVREVFPEFPDDRIIGYSANKHYRLMDLFKAIMDVAPKKYRWYLNNFKDVASYAEKASKNVREDPVYNDVINSLRGGDYEHVR